jgi:hypothetical protein
MRESTRQRIITAATAFFETQPRTVYSRGDAIQIFCLNREDWRLRNFDGFDKTVRFLVENTPFREFKFHSERYGSKFRYSWGICSPYRLGLSLKNASYISHATAAHLHRLIKDLPEAFFVNVEQSVKPRGGTPTQESIDRAFQNAQRRSNYILSCDDWRLILLNGKNSGRLGVADIETKGEQIEVTDVERTLIDLAVRPSYSGGVKIVLEAYKEARLQASVDKLMGYLKKLDYVYPCHQAIGFYMKHGGYSSEEVGKLRYLGLSFDFYLTHAMKDPKFDPDRKVYYPVGLLPIN